MSKSVWNEIIYYSEIIYTNNELQINLFVEVNWSQ